MSARAHLHTHCQVEVTTEKLASACGLQAPALLFRHHSLTGSIGDRLAVNPDQFQLQEA